MDFLIFILEILKSISWPVVFLITVYFFKDTIVLLLNSLAEMINKIHKVDFKNLRLILMDNNVPKESKILLTKNFVEQQAKEGINLLRSLVLSLRLVIDNVTNWTNKKNRLLINQTAGQFEQLKDMLLLLNRKDSEIVALIQSIIEKMRANNELIDQQKFSIIEALELLDANWRTQDPDSFQKIIEIRSLLLQQN